MAAELFLVAAALVATNIHTHTHDTNHTSMRALAHAGSSPILTLSHHTPTPLSLPQTAGTGGSPQSTPTPQDPITPPQWRQVLQMARAGHPPITPTITRLNPAEPSDDLLHQANLTSMRPHHDPTSSAGADELPACPRRVPTRSSMHPHTHGRPRAAQASCARADEPP